MFARKRSVLAGRGESAPVSRCAAKHAHPASLSGVLTAPFSSSPPLSTRRRNIVATVNLKKRLEREGLKKIAMECRNTEYNPQRFAAVIMRVREPKTTALIFGTGKIVVTGARNPDMAKAAAKKYVMIIQKIGFKAAKFDDFKVQNVVASCNVKFPIRLEGLSIGDHSDFSTYEPELFPGLIYRMLNPKVVLLIFVSGKVVLTGAKTPSQIYTAFDNIYSILTKYKKGGST